MEFEPKIFRTIVFVRHGQYSSQPEALTSLGRKQARLTAKALAELNPSKIHCSTMPRAMETAGIISRHVGLQIQPKDMFREGRLSGPVAYNRVVYNGLSLAEKKALLNEAKEARENADLAFNELFKAPKVGQTIEVVVAHGNVIRYWVCKALDVAEEKWLKMDVTHTSLTTIRIAKSGNLTLLGFADAGHLPLAMRTYV